MLKIAQDVLEKNNVQQEAAYALKKECDKKFGPAWYLNRIFIFIYSNRHCVIGKQFASSISSEAKHYAYFYVGAVGVLIWRTLS